MEIIKYPTPDKWQQLSQRALADKADEVKLIVADIIANVAQRGDEAVKEYEQRFTGATLSSLAVSSEEIAEATLEAPIPSSENIVAEKLLQMKSRKSLKSLKKKFKLLIINLPMKHFSIN